MADDDSTAEVEETEESTEDTTKVETWKPPTEAEWRAAQAKVKKANAEAAAHRKQAEELRKKTETEAEAKAREAAETAAKEAEGRWKPRAITLGLKAALAEAGFTGTVEFARRNVDLDALDVDDDGTITGLDEQIRALKKDVPEKFAKKGSGRIDGADREGSGGNGGSPELNTTKKLLGMWQGN